MVKPSNPSSHMSDTLEKSPAYSYVLEQSLRILVVDDDPIQREFASVFVSTPTVEVVCVESGKAALAALRAGKFDLALIDFEMPGMTGLELIEILRRDMQFADLPIIMVTSHEDIATIDAAYHAGATSFVTKPVNWRLLSYHIKFVLK